MTSLEFRDRLARRARRAKARVTLPMLDPLEAYFRLLTLWNATINLTALPLDPPTDETFDRLLVEPLAACSHVPDAAKVWFDLGSGGGSPAIPLKIARPTLKLTMIESRARKSAFLSEAIRMLDLRDASIANQRFEDFAGDEENQGKADVVTVRAVKADAELFRTAALMLSSEGHLLMFRPGHAAETDPPALKRVTTTRLIETPASYLSIFRRSTWNNPR